MLSQEEYNKIELEEQIRNEIRNKLNPPKEKGIWDYANSAIVLWFLSSIVLGSFTWLYSSIEKSVEADNIRVGKIRMLDLEIEGRIYQFLMKTVREGDSLVLVSGSVIIPSNNITPLQISDLWFQFKKAPKESQVGYYSVYEQFDNRNTASLVVELTSLLECKEERETLVGITHKIISNSPIPTRIEQGQEQEILQNVIDSLRIERWQKHWPIIKVRPQRIM